MGITALKGIWVAVSVISNIRNLYSKQLGYGMKVKSRKT
jgi:hypothetical protein